MNYVKDLRNKAPVCNPLPRRIIQENACHGFQKVIVWITVGNVQTNLDIKYEKLLASSFAVNACTD